jgi:hypothetical protein
VNLGLGDAAALAGALAGAREVRRPRRGGGRGPLARLGQGASSLMPTATRRSPIPIPRSHPLPLPAPPLPPFPNPPPTPSAPPPRTPLGQVGRDIGELPLLRDAYEAPRRRANLGMMAALEALQRLFCAGGGALGAARAAGLGAVNAAGPVRDQLMRYAMGLPPA